MELTENTILNKELMQSIPADVAWHYLIIPVDEQDNKLSFACGESTNQLELREKRLPQDGRIQYEGFDIRVSILPTLYGEKIVMRAKSANTSM